MSVFGIWRDFGFTANPYSNGNLPGDPVGDRLLVGRDDVVVQIQNRIASTGVHPTVEGPNGVGKSSMLAVAGYRMQEACLAAREKQLFIPAARLFQANASPDEFEGEVLRAVLQTMRAHFGMWGEVGLPVPNIAGLDKWMNNPQYRTGQAQFVVGAGMGSQPNTSEGFTKTGFRDAVREELERCFPTSESGAIVCIVDNLELLQTSAAARAALEDLRDRIFNMQGLRWVLCGSRGIVTHARSQRLSGVFSPPTEVGPLPDDASMELITRRIREFGTKDFYAPVSPEAFEFLYRALHYNLRDAMAHAQDFSHWLHAEFVATGKGLPPEDDRQPLLEAWLTLQAEKAQAGARVQPRVWTFFDALAANGGRCGASEWERYDFSTQQQHVRAVTDLEGVKLLGRETDPENASKSIAAITPQGWLVYFERNGYEAPQG